MKLESRILQNLAQGHKVLEKERNRALVRALAEVQRLKRALNKYGEHLEACQFDYLSGGCTCGLADEILKESK